MSATLCPACGNTLATVDTACACTAPRPAEAWAFLRGTRRFGPYAAEEMRNCFLAGMVHADDRVEVPGTIGDVSAQDAAARLDAPAPKSGAPARPVLPPVIATSVQAVPASSGLGWRLAGFWLVGLFALQLTLVPKASFAARPTLGEFLLEAGLRFGLAAGLAFAVNALFALVRQRQSSALSPLVAMSVLYLGLAGWQLTHPQPPAPWNVEVVMAPSQVAPPSVAPSTQDVAPADAGRPGQVLVAPFQWQTEAPTTTTATVVPPPPTAARTDATATRRAAVKRRDLRWDEASRLYDAREWAALLALTDAWIPDDPRNVVPRIYRGLAHDNLGQLDLSNADYEQALAIDGRYTLALRNLGGNYMDVDDFTRAVDAYTRWVDLEPRNPTALNALGHAMAFKGEYDEAVEALERAVKIDPGHDAAWRNLIFVHRRAGYPDRASDAANRANARNSRRR